MFKTKEELLEWVYKVLPYSNQICELDSSQDNSIYFTWRYHRWKIFLTGEVYEIEGGCIVGNIPLCLWKSCLKRFIY